MDGKLIAQAGNLIRRESWRLERVTQNVCTIEHSLCVCVCALNQKRGQNSMRCIRVSLLHKVKWISCHLQEITHAVCVQWGVTSVSVSHSALVPFGGPWWTDKLPIEVKVIVAVVSDRNERHPVLRWEAANAEVSKPWVMLNYEKDLQNWHLWDVTINWRIIVGIAFFYLGKSQHSSGASG